MCQRLWLVGSKLMDVFIGPSALALTFFARRLFVGWKAGEFGKGNGEMLSKTCFRSRKRSEHAILFIYLFGGRMFATGSFECMTQWEGGWYVKAFNTNNYTDVLLFCFVCLFVVVVWLLYIYCLITITLLNADYKTQHYLIVLIQLAWLALEGFTENRSIMLVFVLLGFWFRARDQTGVLTPYVPFTFQPTEQHKAKLQTRRSLPVLRRHNIRIRWHWNVRVIVRDTLAAQF